MLGRDAPELGRPKPPALDGEAFGRLTLEPLELPPLDGLALGRRTLLVRLGPVLGRLTEPPEEGAEGGRPTVPVDARLAGGRVTVAERWFEGGRATAGARVTVDVRVGTRLTVPVRVGIRSARPTVLVRTGVVGGLRSTVLVRPDE